ncbi:hypothetical protein FRC15_010465 [Serendipita sp. 397]|nr:hypothetical protein FRC15_010465 [Serendipita sp. 397]
MATEGGPLLDSPTSHCPLELSRTIMILHDAVARGDLRAVADAILYNPDDVNLLDEFNRSVLFCAINGPNGRNPIPSNPVRNNILKMVLARPELSIYALNAAMECAQGATALVLACKLGHLDQVHTLLDCPSVLVNTRDGSGLTPLMYAVKAQFQEIVKALLRKGAHVSILDPFQRSVLHYSQNSNIRIHLEQQLRMERSPKATTSTRASSPSDPSSSASTVENLRGPSAQAESTATSISAANPEALFKSLILSINNQDLLLLQSCLDMIIAHASQAHNPGGRHVHAFAVINRLDEFGFAPIHYAMICSPPNFAVVDALYLAGADVNLLTSKMRSPLQVLVEYTRSISHQDGQMRLFVRHLIHDLQASLRYRDEQSNTCLHLAAEQGVSRELLEALVECDTASVVREWKNHQSFRPVDIAKPYLRDVFEERPESVCTLRPVLRTKRSKASVSSFASLASATSTTTTTAMTSEIPPVSPQDDCEQPFMFDMSLQEALKGSQILLDEIDLSLLQRTLFYRSSLDMDENSAPSSAPKGIDTSLSNTSKAVIAYWNACLGLIREELDNTHKGIVKSHLLVTRTKRDVERKTREDEQELGEAIALWEAHKITEERVVLKDQARGRAFTAPSRVADSSSDNDNSSRFWIIPRKWSATVPPTPTEEHAHSNSAMKRPNRMTIFLKQKLRPLSRTPSPRQEEASPTSPSTQPSPSTQRPRTRPPKLPSLDFGKLTVDDAFMSKDSGKLSRAPSQRAAYSQSTPPSPKEPLSRRTSASAPSSRCSIRKAPVILTRIHSDLLRMEEYTRGIHILASEFQNEIKKAEMMIEHCLLRCSQAEENEYEDEIELEKLRTLLLVGLERKVDDICDALEVVRKWNKLVRSLLRDFRRKVKQGDEPAEQTHLQALFP